MNRRHPALLALIAALCLPACHRQAGKPALQPPTTTTSTTQAAATFTPVDPAFDGCALAGGGLTDVVETPSPPPAVAGAPAVQNPGTNRRYYTATLRGAALFAVVYDVGGPRGLPRRLAVLYKADGTRVERTPGEGGFTLATSC
jgi:hypothetical protein